MSGKKKDFGSDISRLLDDFQLEDIPQAPEPKPEGAAVGASVPANMRQQKRALSKVRARQEQAQRKAERVELTSASFLIPAELKERLRGFTLGAMQRKDPIYSSQSKIAAEGIRIVLDREEGRLVNEADASESRESES